MKTSLSVGERMVILSIMPKEGSFVTLKMIRALGDKLGLSAEELEKFKVTEEAGVVKWDAKAYPVEFTFAEIEHDLIKKELKRMDSENKLNQGMISVYEKFVV